MMFRISAFLGLVFLAAVSLPGYSQAPDPPRAKPQEQAARQQQARPKMPNVITFESSVGEVHFPHKVHQKMGCQRCHHQIHAKDLVTPHEAYLTYSWVNCDDCHNEDSETSTTYYGCARCHHSNLVNIADETLNAKVVVHKSCWKCHLSGTGAKASERCSYCHVRGGKPLDTSAGQPGADARSGPGGSTAGAETK